MESSLQPKALKKRRALSRPIVTAAPRIAAKPNGRTDRRIRQVLPWLVPLLILIVWQSAASFGWITSRIMPSPLAVIKAAVDLATDGQLFSSIAISTGRALSGLIVGGGIGFLLGLSTGLSKWSEVLLDTTVR